MAMQYFFLFSLFLLHSFFIFELAIATAVASPPLSRSSFPKGFLFGAASAAYQYEGAAFEYGRGPSIWDTFTHKFPEKILDGSNGDVTEDFYHRYKGDVQLMKYVGLDAFRLSISWSRILPRGKLSGGINKEGIAFYNNLFDELLSNGIQPFVTLFHWDLPQALEDEYSGFLSPLIVNDFKDFAELCFKEFGDRVKHWITLNEPYIFSLGYDLGLSAPGRCSTWYSNNCTAGNSATEPYLVSHHLLLCHAAAVQLYRQKYKASQNGEIGITLVSHWMVPYSNKIEDIKAAERALDFMYGWYLGPLVHGKYPSTMQRLVGKRLPEFTAEQVMMVKGSFDFLGLNYYTANYAAHVLTSNKVNVSSSSDSRVLLTTEKNGKPIGDPTGTTMFYVYPQGLEKILIYTKEKYNVSTIYITENGIAFASNRTMKENMIDVQRINFFDEHFTALQNAIKAGVNVKGFFVWSFLDTFEWTSGFTLRFGLCYVDYKNGLKRYPKNSALWFRKWLLKK